MFRLPPKQSIQTNYGVSTKLLPALLTVAAIVLAFVDAAAAITVEYSDGRRPVGIETIEEDGDTYLSSVDLSLALGATYFYDLPTQAFILIFDGHRIDFAVGSEIVRGDYKLFQLSESIIERDGIFWLPLETITEVVPGIYEGRVDWNEETNTLKFLQTSPNVVGFSIEPTEEGTLITVELTRHLDFNLSERRTGELELAVDEGFLPDEFALSAPAGLVDSLEFETDKNSVVFNIFLAEEAFSFRTSELDYPPRIEIMIHGISDDYQVKPRLTRRPDLREAVLGDRLSEIEKIVIDPGHGGSDTGVVGPAGTEEKDINLRFADLLKRRLQREGYEVILTRSTDAEVSLRRRVEVANAAVGDLFISIHCDGSFSREPSGVLVAYPSPPRTAIDEEIYFSDRGLPPPLVEWESTPEAYLNESRTFAGEIAHYIRSRGISFRGITQADLIAAKGLLMPMVEIDIGVLTNWDEDLMLSSRERLERTADAVADAVDSFAEWFPRRTRL
jgi:N-acetylmuramoyl-L-alanine amidase